MAYRGIVPDAILDGLSIEQRVEFWTRTLGFATDSTREGRTWVIEDAGAVVGFASTRPARDEDTEPGTGEIASRQPIDFDGVPVDEIRYRLA